MAGRFIDLEVMGIMKQLRDYQTQAILEAWQALRINDQPVLIEASVGSGKSLMIGSILKTIQDQNKRALCLVNSSELVRSNSLEFNGIGGVPSIFCASLNKKEYEHNIIFATPQSIISAIKANHPIKDIIFNMIIVDEAHGIGNDKSIYMQILRHYKQQYKPMRVLGLTGTAFRGSINIVGREAFFKTKVGNISTQYLIEQNYLVPPIFGYHKIKGFDFSKCKPQNTGEFKGSELQAVIDSKKRLTWEIMQEVQQVMQHRTVCMVFCSTKKHCYETLTAIPEGQGAIILADTPDSERNEILTKARNKEIQYLISVNCLLTGINITCLDLLVWLRPTSSLLLYIQGIGRGLRLHPGKTECMVLDYAQNIDRFQDIDNPIINDAVKPTKENEQDYCIPCYECGTDNTIHARRCIGIMNNKRCDYYFEFKPCPACETQNDKVARMCRCCQHELIDPNAKLKLIELTYELTVHEHEIKIEHDGRGQAMIWFVRYNTNQGPINEHYTLATQKGRNIFYANWVRKHVHKASSYYMNLNNFDMLNNMIKDVKMPRLLIVNGEGRIKKKEF